MANAVTIQLVLDGLNEFMAGTKQASRAVEEIDSTAGRVGTGIGKMWGAAKTYGGGALRVLGRGAAVVGQTLTTALGVGAAAAGAFGAKVLAAGGSYNVLYQRSTAAFKTILGSGKAAEQMMDQIAEFAKTSPFPRQAFIAGTQQMLGFGYAAKDVIPTLGVIQDAVAATGGTAQDISELVDIFSRIQGQGRITGEELRRFGMRGINAAQMLGKELGKTPEQVRKLVSRGAVDSAQALEVLTKGMTRSYGGAAAEVKKTWVGATDRIQGAMRDVGSALLEPFVSKRGGGYAVVWANRIADTLRTLEKTVVPALARAFRRIGDAIDPWVTRISDFFMNLKPGQLTGAFKSLSGAMGPIVAGLAGFGGTSMFKSIPLLGQLLGGLNPLVVAFGALVAASPPLRRAFLDILNQLRPLAGTLVREVVPALGAALLDALKALAPLIPPLAQAFLAVVRSLMPLLPILVTLLRLAAPLIEFLLNLIRLLAPAIPYVLALVAAFAALNLVLGLSPLGLITLAIVAVVAAVVLLIRHFDTVKAVAQRVWNAILVAVRFVWNWVKANWPLLLGILTLPFGGAVILIVRYRDRIWDALKAVWNWIKGAWGQLGNTLIQPFQRLVDFVRGIPGRIGDALKRIPGAGVLSKIPGIGGLFSGQYGGTMPRPGGVALVGERGPELVQLPGGTTVQPLAAGGTFNVRVPVYLDKRQIAEAVGQATADRMARR